MKSRIENIYALLERIPVTGDAVDIMAAVRNELRTLHRQIRTKDAAMAQKNVAEQKPPEEAPPVLNSTDKEDSDG